jgi:three-Cys-motif partner protein
MTEPYDGREQTEAKHFILRRYLQTLTFKLLEGGLRELAYVDGFSGPWESRTTDYSDTSFMIAISVLKDAHQKFRDKGTAKVIKCFFVEENLKAYKQLASAVAKHHDPVNGFHIATFQGRFEDSVAEIIKYIGRSFALVFIDPTGWTGYPYHTIAPVLRHRPSEVLINFMYDHINRFASSNDPAIIETLDPILGGANWAERLDPELSRGLAVEKLFRAVLKEEGAFEYVLSTRIYKPTANRPHFFIAYGTRKPNGLKAFRDIEHAALKGHEKRRAKAKQQKKSERTGMTDLFSAQPMPDDNSLEELVDRIRAEATSWTYAYLSDHGPMKFDDLCTAMLQEFMLRVTDVKDICVALAAEGTIVDTWAAEGKRKPHEHHRIGLALKGG